MFCKIFNSHFFPLILLSESEYQYFFLYLLWVTLLRSDCAAWLTATDWGHSGRCLTPGHYVNQVKKNSSMTISIYLDSRWPLVHGKTYQNLKLKCEFQLILLLKILWPGMVCVLSDHHQPSPDTLLRVFLDPIKGWTVSIWIIIIAGMNQHLLKAAGIILPIHKE